MKDLLLKVTKSLLYEIQELEEMQVSSKSINVISINDYLSVLKASPPPPSDFGGDSGYSDYMSEQIEPAETPPPSENSELTVADIPPTKIPKPPKSIIDRVAGFVESQGRRAATNRQIRDLTERQSRGQLNADEEGVLQQHLDNRDKERQNKENVKKQEAKRRREIARLKEQGRKGQLTDEEANYLARLQQSETRRRKNALARIGRGAEDLLFSGFQGVGGFRGLGGIVKPLHKMDVGTAHSGDEHKVYETASKLLTGKLGKSSIVSEPSMGMVAGGHTVPVSVAQQKIAATGNRTTEDQVGELAGLYIESGMIPAAALYEARRVMEGIRKYTPGLGRAIDTIRQTPGIVQSAERKLRSGDIGRGVMEAASYLGGPANVGEGIGLGLKMAREGTFDPGIFKVGGTILQSNAEKLANYLRNNPRANQNPTLMRYVNGLFPAKSINQIVNIIYKMIDIANEEEREIITKGLLFITRDEVLKSIDSYYQSVDLSF